MASPRNHYAVLNVAPDAEPVVIEAAYRALMKKYHPDQGQAEAGARSATDINNAFAVLRDPQRRADYDHREATRSQAIQLAQFQQALPPPPRASNFFGWGGWLVALVLAGAIGIIASQSSPVPPLVRVETAKAAPLPEPKLGSQPAISEVPPAELAEIRSDALLGRSSTAGEGAARRLRISHPARLRTRRPGDSRALSDRDFVERHGGIY
jgi:hypothetical protein